MFTLSDFQRDDNNVNKYRNTDFLTLLFRKWDEIHDKCDVFRYKIDKLHEKVVDGYLLQLNPDRNTKRRTPEQIDNIRQPFDGAKFNFTRVSPQEILFTLKKDLKDTDVYSIIVNVSPVSRYHSLICPSIDNGLPQVVTEESLQFVINLMFLVKNRAFRIGFNSLCGLASVNHLHYHIFYENHLLIAETAKCNHIHGSLSRLNKEYPIPGFCFEIPSLESVKNTTKHVFKLLDHLLNRSIAHNIFITRCMSVNGEAEVVRVLVWPRKSTSGVKQLTHINVALLELSGWFPVFSADDYENLKPKDLENILKKWSIDNFEDLCKEIKLLY